MPVLLQMVLRAFSGVSAGMLTILSVSLLPIGVAMTLVFISPTLTALLSAVLFGEPLTLVHLLNLVANIVGISLVTDLFSDRDTPTLSLLGIFSALGGAACMTVVALTLRRLGTLGIPPMVMTFPIGIGYLTASMFLVRPPDVQMLFTRDWRGLICNILNAVLAFMAQTFLAMALRDAPAGPAVVVRSLTVPISFLLGLLVLGEKFTTTEMVGVLMIVVSVTVVGVMQSKDAEQSQ